MIHFSPDIWECPGQYVVCRIVFIGWDCVTTFVLTWHHVLFVWHASLRVHGGLPWDTLMWGTDGIGWRWTSWTCLSPLRKAIGTFWLWRTVSPDGWKRWTARPLPDKTALTVAEDLFQHIVCRFGMPMVIHSDQGREFDIKVIQELCLLCGSHKPGRLRTIRRVMVWWNALIGRY